jgi:hypothetical protein
VSNLSPEQFMQQHADFEKWTKNEETRITEKNRQPHANPNVHYSSFPREDGKKMTMLRGARTWLQDTYSEAAHEAIHEKKPFDKSWVAGPLHEMVDERYHPLVNEYLEGKR